MSDPVHVIVDHLFRHSAGQMVATLTRVFGPAHLSLAEEVVQEALIAAMQQWSIRGIPENPRGWLFQVARNRALDQIRRETTLRGKEAEIVTAFRDRGGDDEPAFAHEVRDDQLRMMLMCCHPSIPKEARVALTLKTVGGFSVDEIARALLTKKETIAQRIVRAKRLIRDEHIPMDLPSRDELPRRLETLLEVLYLMFNEGYGAHAGEELVRHDLAAEAIRLGRALVEHPATCLPESEALLALMLLQGARLPARIDAAGELATLAQQDRALWDQRMIAEGLRAFGRSATGEKLTAYHVEAAIASYHAAAPAFDETDWPAIVAHYDRLLELKPTPVVALNRAVAIAIATEPAAGIAAIEEIAGHPALRDYLPLHATLGELWLRCRNPERAAAHFSRALELPATLTEKRFLMAKLKQTRAARV
ncbi:MAG TPA: sigma-70 family RNA polymerase sigma factor [Thermoanaerobaculia bacterium]|nr:sigma-70 family RNA polymerase sigma factor [Thermoanaerobaculia bacterium]